MNFIPKIEYTELNTAILKTITFDSPPEGDPFNEEDKVIAKSKRSTNGTRATQFNYTLTSYNLQFIFQSQSVTDAMKDFVRNHAGQGGNFKYFIHSDEVEFETFELVNSTVKYSRPLPAATVGEFEYDFKFKIERVL